MKIRKLLPFIGLLLVALISNAQKPRYIKTDNFEGVAFPFIQGMPAEIKKNEFMPSVKDIIKMEKKISDSLSFIVSAYEKQIAQEYMNRDVPHCDIIENLHQYKRQYTGTIINGKKVIITFFYLHVPENWKKEIYSPIESSRCEELKICYSVVSGKLFNFFTDLSRM